MEKRSEESVVRAVAEPEFTETWHPVSHARVLDSLEAATAEAGLSITDRSYSLTDSGGNMFGTWGLLDGDTDKEIGWQLGFRNSITGKFAVGLTAGTTVFVCSNMMFSGEFLTFRRHTKGMDDAELLRLSTEAIGMLITKIEGEVKWHAGLREVPVDPVDFKVLTYDAMAKGVFPSSKFSSFLQCHDEELEIANGTQNLYTFHGAATRLMRNESLFQIANRSVALKNVADDYMMRVTA